MRFAGQPCSFCLYKMLAHGSRWWRRERGRRVRAQNLRMPVCWATHAATCRDESRQPMCMVRWGAWKSPGQYRVGGVSEQRLLGQHSRSEACYKNMTNNFCVTQGRIALSCCFNYGFSFLCFKLNTLNPSFLSVLWLPCVELGHNAHLGLVTLGQHPPSEAVAWNRAAMGLCGESSWAGERDLHLGSHLSKPQPVEVSSTGACAVWAGNQLWQRWVKPPAKYRPAKGLGVTSGALHRLDNDPSLRLAPVWDSRKTETGSGMWSQNKYFHSSGHVTCHRKVCSEDNGWHRTAALQGSSVPCRQPACARAPDACDSGSPSRFPLQARKFLP